MKNEILQGDVIARLKDIPDDYVQIHIGEVDGEELNLMRIVEKFKKLTKVLIVEIQ